MEFGVQGLSNVMLLDYVTKSPILFLKEVLFTNIGLVGDLVKQKGGEQGLNLMAWNNKSDATFTIHTPIFSMKFLEVSAGADFYQKEQIVAEVELLEVEDDKATLKYEPIESKEFFIYEMDKSARNMLDQVIDYDLDGQDIILETSISNEWILVFYYHKDQYNINNIGKFINRGFYTLVGTATLYNQNEAKEEELKFEFPKVQINQQFNLQMLNSKNPNQIFSIECTALIESTNDKTLLRLMTRDEGDS